MLVKNLKFCLVYETDTIRKCILNLEKSTQQIIFELTNKKTFRINNRWRYKKSHIK